MTYENFANWTTEQFWFRYIQISTFRYILFRQNNYIHILFHILTWVPIHFDLRYLVTLSCINAHPPQLLLFGGLRLRQTPVSRMRGETSTSLSLTHTCYYFWLDWILYQHFSLHSSYICTIRGLHGFKKIFYEMFGKSKTMQTCLLLLHT